MTGVGLRGVQSSRMDSTLNLSFAEWTAVLGSERLIGALLVLLGHKKNILV